MAKTNLVWLRNDLRMADNPALHAAHEDGARVVALYIHETTEGVRPTGAAGRWWAHHSLETLGSSLAAQGVELLVRSGDARRLVPQIAAELGATAALWNRRYAPGEREADAEIKAALVQAGLDATSCPGNVLVEPWEIATGQGKPYSVFGPFWKNLRDQPISRPLRRPEPASPAVAFAGDASYEAPHWSGKFAPYWRIGEAAAAEELGRFLDEQLDDYALGRDFPRQEATSRISPHLRWGEISPRQVWHAALAVAHADHRKQEAVNKFLSELAWRDFNYHQLYHRPDVSTEPMQGKYRAMPWRQSSEDLKAWQQGRTGLPIVDAGMREMWETGFMQNRVRMLTASLLTKNLLIDWRIGEQWFWDCLMDADIANNAGNWQWVAGSGLDASPFFRIFNPVTQGERFDGSGDYVRRWVPKLASLPDKWIHEPAAAPADVLRQAGLRIGETYPAPIVDLRESRVRALEAAKVL